MARFNRLLSRLFLVPVLATLFLSAAALGADRRNDPKNLVSYVLPAKWSDKRIGNGRHFQRADRPKDKAILAVIPEVRTEYMTLEQTRTGRSNVHAVQDHKQIHSAVSEINGFQVWEATYVANIRGDNVILHDFMMFSETRVIEVHLIAAKDNYDTYLLDLRALVDSVEVFHE